MQHAEQLEPVRKVHWLVVDKESLIETAKEVIGVDHHISIDHFFETLEGIMREHPLPIYRGVNLDRMGCSGADLPVHVMVSLETMRKRQALVLDMPRLLTFWPGEQTDLLVVSVCDTIYGHVPRVPEAFHFLADTVCIIQKQGVAPVRVRNNSAFFDKIAEVLPVNSEILNTIR